jgi:hypothetical protein
VELIPIVVEAVRVDRKDVVLAGLRIRELIVSGARLPATVG